MWKDHYYSNFQKAQVPFLFSMIEKEICLIPCTEAAVERVFSALSKVSSSDMCNVKQDTLNARLIVKFDSIFGAAGSVTLNDLINDPIKSLKLEKYPQLGY